jgi:hypothetical protein
MKKGLPRRTFLKYVLAALAGGIAAGAGNLGFAALPGRPGHRLDGRLSYQTFAGLVGQPFTLVAVQSGRKIAARILLTEIVPVALAPENDQFYLVFQVFASRLRPNGVYRIRHATAGSTKLLLQPLGNIREGNYCRADFNLLL